MRDGKLKAVKKTLKIQEGENVEISMNELKTREMKIVGDFANQKEVAKVKKDKNDEELKLKDEHERKR